METPAFRAQLETEFEWRIKELRFFQNLCEELELETSRDQFRRATVLLLYSHFEGYCKFSFNLYVSAINSAGLLCNQVNSSVVTATLHDVFSKLRDGAGKAPEFKNALPDDSKLHKFALAREFVERSAEIMGRPVFIPDQVVDTESNLKPIVLRKNLFRLGLPHDEFANFEPSINKLLAVRNKIAHGESRAGIEKSRYDELRDSALQVMTGVTTGITRAFDEKKFMR